MYTSNGFELSEAPNRLGTLEPVPAALRDDRDALRERLERDGYLFLRGALDRQLVLDFRRYYFDALAGTGVSGTEPDEHGALGRTTDEPLDQAAFRHKLFRDIVPGPEYAAFCTQAAVRGWYAWFLGGDPFLHRRKIIRHIAPAERGIGTATQAHYDLLYLRGGSESVLSSWIPLGDTPIARGGLTYLENSHHHVRGEEARRAEKRPPANMTPDLPGLADEHDSRWLITDYEAGDMVVHTSHTIHAALDNADPDGFIRLSTDIRYQRADAAIDGRWQNHWHPDDGL
jgi:hypothetical protein